MAVINCPSCNKKISDKAKTCSHCDVDLSNQEQLNSIKRINRIKKSQTLMNYSFIAMLLFCGGFLFMFWQDVHPGSWQHTAAMTSTAVGFILYIFIRIRLIILKRNTK
ncbi:zinc ribbon domain-containing protein [Thalassomonas actiniarum]|uniref:Zinc ribbon domain-containing protein n=1 Tax=Thalassomonas actiniarum TaxID=485447 RepID=A0AAF0BWI3_9GAMM|nr:zinc ribbon domain-containing protein [Thalassomonas actiniarum]WDD96651.1 zinc ribbon domain-containing protein [Thalassomonas actiniarum]